MFTIMAMLVSGASPLGAQTSAADDAADTLALSAGARVRAEAFINSCLRLTELRGDLLAVRHDTLILARQKERDTTALTLGQVHRLVVTDGVRSSTHARRWALLGIPVGAALVAVVQRQGCALGEECGPSTAGVAIGGAGGAAAGFLVGLARKDVRWQRVTVPAALPGPRRCPRIEPYGIR